MLGDFELDRNAPNDNCFLGLCFRRHSFFKSNSISVKRINVGESPHIVFKSGVFNARAKIAKNRQSLEDEIKELEDVRQQATFTLSSLTKAPRPFLEKAPEGRPF